MGHPRTEKFKIIETKGNQVFSVPNTLSGREFIKLLRVYVSPGCSIRTRGRGKNRMAKGGNGQDTPRHNADWLAVYIEGKVPFNLGEHKKKAWEYGHAEGVRLGYIHERIALMDRLENLNGKIGDSL